MTTDLKGAADALLERVTTGHPRVPGVAAIATDREGTIYAGAAGKRMLGAEANFATDTVCAIFSTTKAIAATAALTLVEEGRLDLDAPASRYVPAIADLQVLDGFDADGAPRLRAPKREITTRMLLLHTAGFAYDLFNEDYRRLAERGQPGVMEARMACLTTPLLFDPGEAWEYGSNIDWAGLVVEGITGQRLGEVMAERIFAPCGMTSTAFTLSRDMRSRLARAHIRGEDGGLTPMPDFELPPDPAVHMGGHGLYGTAEDYARFIRMWLNDGMGDEGRVLKPETVAMAAENGLPAGMTIKGLPAVNPAFTNYAEFFPGMRKTWGLSFMINEEEAPTGRPAGSLAWAGLANLYFWIDRQTGIGGFWATQIFPFADKTSVEGYLEFETLVYRSLTAARAA